MKKILLASIASILTFAAISVSAATTLEGKINRIFSSENGGFAILMESGIPASAIEAECPTANNFAGWPYDAELEAQRNFIKSQLLSALMADKTILLSLSGCASGGGWVNISNVYLLKH